MSEKIVLIDGHSILNRAFYGVPDLTSSEGLHTNGVYGFLNIMLKILEEEKPQYLAVAFDRKEPTFRHQRYKEYKGTRKPMPEELRQQVPVIQEVLSAMEIPVITQAGIEADDILGTIATRAQGEGKEVTLVSGDRDLLQLASDKILIRVPKTKRGGTEIEDYHTEDVVEKYGITPHQIIDMKGLMGDSSDNIPGVPGVGEKTAIKILTAFPTVEEAYEHIEEVEPKRARELLRANKELAYLSKELATIKTDCDFDFSFEDARYENIFTEEAYHWIKKLELKSLEKKFKAETVSAVTAAAVEFKTIVDKKQAQKCIRTLLKDKPERVGVGFLADEWSNTGAVKKKTKKKSVAQLSLVFDEEDLSLSVGEETSEKEYAFLGMSLAYQGKEPVVLCFLAGEELSGEELLSLYRQVEEEIPEVDVLDWKNMMHHVTPVVTLSEQKEAPNQQGFLDDTQEQRDCLFEKVFDVSIAAYLLNPLKNSYHVEDIARDYLGDTVASFTEVFGKKRLAELCKEEAYLDFLTHPEKEFGKSLISYLGNLAYVPVMAAKSMREELSEKEMLSLMEEIEMPTAYYLYQMERVGVQVEKEELASISRLLESKVLARETDIYDLAGEEFNINSPKQLGVILFEKMKLPFAKKTKTGYSTSAEILEKLKHEDPIVEKILEYRQVSKLKSTYADGLPVFIETDKRIHGKFNQTITATGRISSTEPNLQNIPIRMELGREIRKVFRPREGWVFLDADYSQIELRVLAHMAGDEEMIAAYQNGQDIHRSTAAKVFHTPFEEVTELQRRNAKAVNFGIVYGISSFGLSQDLNISKKEAQEYIDEYFAMYPAIKAFIDQLVADAREKKYAETLFHRKRPIPELSSGNYMQRSFGERVAMNSPIQGTAADIIKLAMIRVAARLKRENLKAKIVLQVHDELLVETPMEEKEQVRQILLEEMPHVVALKVPLEVEVLEGSNWKEAH